MLQITQTCEAASILFNLEGHIVLSAGRVGTGRTVLVEPIEREGACPDCGVLCSRIQARPVHRVPDVQCGGAPVEVLVRKRRLACLEAECQRRSFVQTTDEIPLRSRLTSRLVAASSRDCPLNSVPSPGSPPPPGCCGRPSCG